MGRPGGDADHYWGAFLISHPSLDIKQGSVCPLSPSCELQRQASTQALCSEGSHFVLMKRLRVQSLRITYYCSFWLHYLNPLGLYLLICKTGMIVPHKARLPHKVVQIKLADTVRC